MMVFKKKVVFCADTTVTIEPTAEELAETAILAAECVFPVALADLAMVIGWSRTDFIMRFTSSV